MAIDPSVDCFKACLDSLTILSAATCSSLFYSFARLNISTICGSHCDLIEYGMLKVFIFVRNCFV